MNARNIFPSSTAIADEIARHVELEDVRKSESLLAEAEQLANLGSWEHDLETGEETWSANLCRILGAGIQTRKFSKEVFWELLHPDDRQMVRMRIESGMKYRQPYEYQARFVPPDGRERILLTRGKPVADSANRIIKRVGFTQDVTITVEGQRALLESEERYRDLVENSHDLICTHDMGGVLLSMNELPARILGYRREELIGRSVPEFLAPEVREQFGEYFKQIERDGSANGLMVLMTRSGERRVWEYTNTLRTEGVPAPIVRGIAHDVTERFNAQKALHDSQARLSALIESIDDVVIELDLEGTVLDIWTTRPELLFCPREEQIGRRVSEIIGPDFFRPFAEIFKRVLASGRSEELEYPLSLGVGQRWFVARVTPILAADGTYKSVCLLVRDITERKQAEQKLLKQERLQAQAEELASLGSWESNEETGEVIWSPQQCRNLGVDPQETRPTAELFWKLVHPEDRKRVLLESSKAITKSRPFDYEARFVLLDGRTRVLHTRALPITDSSGQVVRWVGMSQDITERKRTEEALSLFRTLIDQSNDAVEVVDPNTLRMLDMNQKGCADLGYSREEILSLTIFDIDPTLDDALFARANKELRKSGSLIWEGVHIRKDRSTYPVEVNVRLIQLEGKEYVVSVARDIAERKRAEEALRASEQEQRRIAEQLERERARLVEAQEVAKIGSWELELQSLNITWSEQTHRIFETDPSRFHPTRPKFREFIHPEDRKKVDAAFEASIDEPSPCSVEYRIVMPDGSIKFLEERWQTFHDEQGKPVRVAGTCRDITELALAEEELRQVRERMGSILNSVSDTFILFDRQWRYLYLNDAAVRATGRLLKEIVGHTLWELFPEVVGTELDRQFHRAMDAGVHVEFHFLQPGFDRWWEIRTYPAPEGLAVFATEITERKQAEEEHRRLSSQLLHLQDNERRKIAFHLHESVAQDLVGLRLCLGQLKRGSDLPESLRKFVDEAMKISHVMVQDIRTLSYSLHPPRFEQTGLATAVPWYAAEFAERSGIQVEVEISDGVGRLEPNQETALFRIMQESLTNIHRHSGSDWAHIRVWRTGCTITMEIRDRGKGMSADSTARLSHGASFGVGIAGMRERVKELNGTFSIESASRKGVTVRVGLPRLTNTLTS
jgi:PAS domain S-box-containing protein